MEVLPLSDLSNLDVSLSLVARVGRELIEPPNLTGSNIVLLVRAITPGFLSLILQPIPEEYW